MESHQHPSLIWNKDFLLLWAGKVQSGIGSSLYSIALAYMILEVTGSEAYIGFILAVGAIPSFFSPLAGAIIDRIPMKGVLISGDLARVAILLIVGTLFLTSALTVGMIFAASIIISLIGIFYAPTFATLLPRLVPESDISRANALNSMTGNVTQLAGYAVGGLVISTIGLSNTIMLTGLTFLGMALCIAFIRFPSLDVKGESRNLPLLIREGFRYLLGRRVLLAVPILFVVTNAATYAFRILMPERMNEIGLGVNGYSWFFGSLFAGAFLIDILMSKFSLKSYLLKRVGLGLLGLASGVIVVVLSQHFAMYLAGGLIVGAADSFISICLVTVVHTACDSKYMGRVWGTFPIIEEFGMMLVTAGVGAATLRWDFAAILLIVAGMFLIAGVVTALAGRSIETVQKDPAEPAVLN